MERTDSLLLVVYVQQRGGLRRVRSQKEDFSWGWAGGVLLILTVTIVLVVVV
jgi:hypothetical protein